MKEYTYNFVKQTISFAAFARVKLSIEISFHDNEVKLLLPENPIHDDGEVNADTNPSWVQAVVEGAQEALEFITQSTSAHHSVHILNIRGTDVDSTPETMRCAASLAVLCCLMVEDVDTYLVRQDRRYFIDYEKLKLRISE